MIQRIGSTEQPAAGVLAERAMQRDARLVLRAEVPQQLVPQHAVTAEYQYAHLVRDPVERSSR